MRLTFADEIKPQRKNRLYELKGFYYHYQTSTKSWRLYHPEEVFRADGGLTAIVNPRERVFGSRGECVIYILDVAK